MPTLMAFVVLRRYDEDPWLQFWNDDDKINTVVASTNNDGSYSWTVPGTKHYSTGIPFN